MNMDTIKIIDIVANALNDKKAIDINVIGVEDLTVLTEYFVIATATSSTHVRSLADEVEDKLSENGVTPDHIEGRSTGWLVLDYGSVIVHIFTKDQREFYNLDKIWSDGKLLDLDNILKQSQGD
ncbi:MAG: ribosome silencing factor [Clostridia bacterium]|nr:ribosome silencing factor [Clostridia bacterium]